MKINLRFKLLGEDGENRVANSNKDELAIVKYNSLSERRKHFDALFWQIPALSLGGQAFLLSIALNDSSRTTARTLSALLGIFIAFVSLASLSRIRFYEFTITNMLKKAEEELFGYRFSDNESQEWIDAGKKAGVSISLLLRNKITHKIYSYLYPFQSYRIWVLTQILFILVGIFIIGNSFLGHDLFTRT
ncbi:unannotated protein [freshwater metagenome]|uniref:Unannotated protein n=1 Tax=freshwater metagenome TaxID=449393 RepID=A0A6J7QIX5_9ZZZZ